MKINQENKTKKVKKELFMLTAEYQINKISTSSSQYEE